MVGCISHPVFSRFLSKKFQKYKSWNALESAIYQYMMGIPIEEYEKCFHEMWIDRLKSVSKPRVTGRINGSNINKCRWKQHSFFIFGTSLVYQCVATISISFLIGHSVFTLLLFGIPYHLLVSYMIWSIVYDLK